MPITHDERRRQSTAGQTSSLDVRHNHFTPVDPCEDPDRRRDDPHMSVAIERLQALCAVVEGWAMCCRLFNERMLGASPDEGPAGPETWPGGSPGGAVDELHLTIHILGLDVERLGAEVNRLSVIG